jgi:sulfatase modifying factor 1
MRMGPLLLTLLTLLWSLPAFAQEKQRVAVLELQGDLPSNILLLISDEVRDGALDAFSGHDNYSVMTRENMFTLLTDMGLDPEECMADANCEVDAGRNIGAAYVVAGQVTMVEGTLMMTLKLFATGSGDMLESERIEAESQKGLISKTKGASQSMVAQGLGLGQRRVSVAPVTASDIDASPMSSTTSLSDGADDYLSQLAALEEAKRLRERIEAEEAAAEVERQAELRRLEEERARAEAERQAELERLEEERARAKAERQAALERIEEEERKLHARLATQRAEQFKKEGDAIRAEASRLWQATSSLREAGGPEATEAVRAFRERYSRSETTVKDATGSYSELVVIPEVAWSETWLASATTNTSTVEVEVPVRKAQAKTQVTVKGVSFTLAHAPAGTFKMGSPRSESGRGSDERQHTVKLSEGFHIGTTEVTQALYEEVMGSNPSSNSSCAITDHRVGATCPVENVSWYDAVEFCNKLSQLEGWEPAYTISGTSVKRVAGASGYRLPTEAEWEYAARAGESHTYAGSNSVGDVAWYKTNSGDKTHPVGTKAANAWGLHDMSGNVYEWTGDWYGKYPTGSVTDPQGPPTSGFYRVYRGGSFDYTADWTRAANRYWSIPGNAGDNLGFRVVLPEPPPW